MTSLALADSSSGKAYRVDMPNAVIHEEFLDVGVVERNKCAGGEHLCNELKDAFGGYLAPLSRSDANMYKYALDVSITFSLHP